MSHCSRQSPWKVCPQLGSTFTFSPVLKSDRQIEQVLYLKELRPFAFGVTEEDDGEDKDEALLSPESLLFNKFT